MFGSDSGGAKYPNSQDLRREELNRQNQLSDDQRIVLNIRIAKLVGLIANHMQTTHAPFSLAGSAFQAKSVSGANQEMRKILVSEFQHHRTAHYKSNIENFNNYTKSWSDFLAPFFSAPIELDVLIHCLKLSHYQWVRSLDESQRGKYFLERMIDELECEEFCKYHIFENGKPILSKELQNKINEKYFFSTENLKKLKEPDELTLLLFALAAKIKEEAEIPKERLLLVSDEKKSNAAKKNKSFHQYFELHLKGSIDVIQFFSILQYYENEKEFKKQEISDFKKRISSEFKIDSVKDEDIIKSLSMNGICSLAKIAKQTDENIFRQVMTAMGYEEISYQEYNKPQQKNSTENFLNLFEIRHGKGKGSIFSEAPIFFVKLKKWIEENKEALKILFQKNTELMAILNSQSPSREDVYKIAKAKFTSFDNLLSIISASKDRMAEKILLAMGYEYDKKQNKYIQKPLDINREVTLNTQQHSPLATEIGDVDSTQVRSRQLR